MDGKHERALLGEVAARARLHSHPTAESLYVLEGEIVLHLGGVDTPLAAGSFASAPAGVPHAFKVVSAGARILFLHTPGPSHCEAFYLEASEPLPTQTDADMDLGRVRRAPRAPAE